MQIEYKSLGNMLIVKLTGELDHHTAKEIREKVDLKIAGGIYKDLVFDFSSLTFMDSSGIGVIMGRVKNLSVLGGRVYIASPNGVVSRIISLSGLTAYVKVFSSIEDAVSNI